MNGVEAGAGLKADEQLIRLRHVKKIYQSRGGAVTALKDVELTVTAGEFMAVIGKSGAGKTTLINMIAGIDRATSGEIEVAGAGIHHLNEDQRAEWRGRSVGIIFQFFQLLPTMTALQNVMLPMDFAHRYSRSQQKERAMALLEQMGIAAHAAKLPSAMSGGQQQRIAIARALANDPPLLLADEPTGSLDSNTAGEMMDIFIDLTAKGKTLLLVTHDNDLAKRAGRMVVLADGEILNERGEPITA